MVRCSWNVWRIVVSRNCYKYFHLQISKEAFDIIEIPGENVHSPWIANKSAFKQIEEHMDQGREVEKLEHSYIKR